MRTVQSFNVDTGLWTLIDVDTGAPLKSSGREWPDVPKATKDKLIAFREENPPRLNVKPSDPLADYRR